MRHCTVHNRARAGNENVIPAGFCVRNRLRVQVNAVVRQVPPCDDNTCTVNIQSNHANVRVTKARSKRGSPAMMYENRPENRRYGLFVPFSAWLMLVEPMANTEGGSPARHTCAIEPARTAYTGKHRRCQLTTRFLPTMGLQHDFTPSPAILVGVLDADTLIPRPSGPASSTASWATAGTAQINRESVTHQLAFKRSDAKTRTVSTTAAATGIASTCGSVGRRM